MIPNLFILSSTGEVLIEKQWIGRHKRTVCDLFWEESSHPTAATIAATPATLSSSAPPTSTTLPSTSSASPPSSSSSSFPSSPTSPPALHKPPPVPRHQVPPVLAIGRYAFISIHRSSLTFLVCTLRESPPLFVIEFLQLIADVFVSYFSASDVVGVGELTESGLRDHFSTVYQLLDEMVDGGYASTTELNLLTELITPPSLASKLLQTVTNEATVKDVLPQSAVSKIPWRKANVAYVANEIYFDINEQLDAIVNSNGNVVHATVYGDIMCNCRLSGVPDLTLTFTRPALLDDCSLHRCVRINRFQRERVISFVPPDGPFKLLSYKVAAGIALPVYVKPQIAYRAGSGRIHIMVGSKLHSDKAVTDVVVILPLPSPLRSHTLAVTVGKLTVADQTVRWEIAALPRDMVPMMEGGVSLTGGDSGYVGILQCEWTVKMYAASGLKVEGLAIRNVAYKKPYKGVRSVTSAGKFQVRCVE